MGCLPLLLLRLSLFFFLGTSKSPQEQSQFRVYVYDWPPSVTDVWPGENNFTHHRPSTQHVFRANAGTGPIEAPSVGRHRTHQYSLFLTLLTRLRESAVITQDPEQASAYFVPYDIGMDATTRSIDAALTVTGCPRMKPALTLLNASPYFRRHQGRDHFILHSVNQPMTYFVNADCQTWYKACINCLKLSIDVYPTDMFRVLRDKPEMTRRWVSIPFPSDYHYSADVAVAPWKDRVDVARRFPIAFVGSTAVTARRARDLREAILDRCALHSEHCLLRRITDHSSNAVTAALHEAASSSAGLAPAAELGPYYDASLCLMPGGDFPTRKAVLDALLVGCVPVVFQRATAITQWTQHWGSRAAAAEVLIYIPMAKFMGDPEGQFLSLVAMSRNESFMTERRRRISALGSRLQYNLPGNARALERGAAEPDAVDVILDSLRTGAWL